MSFIVSAHLLAGKLLALPIEHANSLALPALLDLKPNQKVFAEAQGLIRKTSAEITDERLRSVFFGLMRCKDSSCSHPDPGTHEQLNISKPDLD